MKKKAYCYKINLHFLFLTAICHKGGKFLGIRDFFSIFFAGINFRGFNKIEYFAGTNFRDFGQKPRKARKLIPEKISTTKVLQRNSNLVILGNLGMPFFSVWVLFREHSRITGLQGKGRAFYLLLTTTSTLFADT